MTEMEKGAKVKFLRKRLLMACLYGSKAHGTSMPDSDLDVRGVYIPNRLSINSPFPDMSAVSLKEDDKERDMLFWEGRQFANMLSSCNPNILEVLWAPTETMLHHHPAWEALAAHKERFLTKRVSSTFRGYANGEIKRIQKLIAQPDHDAYKARKSAAHVVRLLRIAHEALRGEGIIIVRPDWKELIAYKSNALSIERALEEAAFLNEGLEQARASSVLPEEFPIELLVKATSEMMEEYIKLGPLPIRGLLRQVLDIPQTVKQETKSGYLQGRAVVLDIEGAGHSKQNVRDIMEIAMLETIDGVATGNAFYTRLRPDRKPTSFVKRLHGLHWPDVKNSPRIEDIYQRMMTFIGDSPIVAHSAASDKSMLMNDLQVAGLPMPKNTWLCTARLFQAIQVGSKKGSPSLDAICDGLDVDRGIREEKGHGAALDVALTTECFCKMMTMKKVPLLAWGILPKNKKAMRARRLSLSVQDGVQVILAFDGENTEILPVPPMDHGTHFLSQWAGTITVRRREDKILDNPLGDCKIFWKKQKIYGLTLVDGLQHLTKLGSYKRNDPQADQDSDDTAWSPPSP